MSNEQGNESTVSRNQSIKEEQMAEEKEAPKKLSRREFVKGAAAVAGAGALASCAPAATPAPGETGAPAPTCPPAGECPVPGVPETWDYEADVVVVGYGGAGAIAAFTAHDAGAKVLLLEKQPADTPTEIRHTPSTRYCGGGQFTWVGSKEDGVTFLRYATWGMVPDDVLEAYTEGYMDNARWTESIGGTAYVTEMGAAEYLEDSPGLAGGDNWRRMRLLSPEEYEAIGHDDSRSFNLYAKNVTERGIEVLYEHPAKRLIFNPATEEVIGVECETAGGPVYVKAKKAVALTCGGFEHDERLKMEAYKGVQFRFYANPANTGDGVVMASALGAEMIHMPCVSGRNNMMWFEGLPTGIPNQVISDEGGTLVVDQYGNRFMDETDPPGPSHSSYQVLQYWDPDLHDYTRNPCWYVFDETRRLAGPIAESQLMRLGWDIMAWSDSNEDEIAKGWIVKGETIEELAENIAAHEENSGRMTAAALRETIDNYNEYCATGVDLEFGRDRRLVPFSVPPYYAVNAYPGGPNTQGGPRKNGKCQVQRVDGTVIKRLYCGGELGSMNTVSYPMKNMSEIVITGRIIGASAVAEEPWE